jgi:Encapsulating protein for peroxidase
MAARGMIRWPLASMRFATPETTEGPRPESKARNPTAATYSGVWRTCFINSVPATSKKRVSVAPGHRGPRPDKAFALSTRGGDFDLQPGTDVAIGYLSHDADTVHLYLQETLTFLVYTAEASVALTP